MNVYVLIHMKFIYKKQSFLLHIASNINQTAVGLFWLSNNNFF